MKKILLATFGILVFSSVTHAALIDLTTAGSKYVNVNGAQFWEAGIAPAGTGVFESFWRSKAGLPDFYNGYNTSASPLPGDNTDMNDAWTTDLLLSEVPIMNLGGTDYREFMLDINQTRNDPLLSLDILQIYESNIGGLSDKTLLGVDPNYPIVYDLGANTILLNYELNAGSGKGDMFAYIPDSLFSLPYIYLYASFGNYGDYNNNDGFEEWAVREATSQVPLPAAAWLLGSGLVGLVLVRRRK